MLIRAEFEKLNPVKYISHLELMTTFRRAFRRAGLPLAYSKGFNPHILLSLGQPLKVGMIGWKEYFDLGLSGDLEVEEFRNMINKELPEGLKIVKARSIPEDSKSLMATINTAIYIFRMNFSSKNLPEEEILNRFLKEDEIIVRRERRKKSNKEINIRPLIYSAEVIEPARWIFQVESGSQGNLRPEEISRALAEFFKEIEDTPIINIEREGLYVRMGDDLYSPLDEKIIGR